AVETFGADGAPLRRALDTAGIGIAKEAELTVAIVAAGGVQTLIGPLLAGGVDALADAPCVECVRYWIRV
ncbi:hypothetical protein QM306_40845, partial [Burkholderia cenocepacia]|nr:hypothetical protein [Burkholderia cenocepacia]